MPKKEITVQEQAAIYYGIHNNLSILGMYCICHDDGNELKNRSEANAWINAKRIRPYYDRVLADFRNKSQEEKKRRREEEMTETGEIKVDFTDKAQFIKYLNQTANRMTDDKLKNDILKMLSDHLDFKDENKRGENSEIQRFYLPIRCQDCKIYQAAAQEQGNLFTL